MTHTAALDAAALESPGSSGSSGWLREVVVHVSMVIVVGALGIALRASLGLGVASSIVGAAVVYWGLLLVHGFVRRGQDVLDLSEELAQLEDENAELRRLHGARRPVSADRDPRRFGTLDVPPRPAPAVFKKAEPQAISRPVAKAPVRPPESARPPVKAAPVRPPESAAKAGARPQPPARQSAPSARPAPAGARVPPPLPAARPPAQGLAVLVAERPVAPAAPTQKAVQPPRDASKAPAKPAPESQPGTEDPRAQDIAIMQSLIKGLADQLNAPKVEAKPSPVPSMDIVPGAPMLEIPHGPPQTAPRSPMPDPIDRQVDALRDAASAMRGEPTAEPTLDGPVADLSLHAQLAGALEEARIDVYLDPILGLDDRKARHFEVSVRLRNDDGDLLDPRDFTDAIAGTGLGPRIEAHTFTETIRLAGQFAARGAQADLFADASAESIRDSGFHAALANALVPDTSMATRLVMSIAQSEIRGFGPAHWEALSSMAQAGLRYALVDVVDLDMDFERLKAHGFDFVRLDAPVFLKGLAGPHGFVPAADLCRHLSGLGFTMIVNRIADERELVKVFGFGALLGQGRLFGAPRPIRLDRSAAASNAA